MSLSFSVVDELSCLYVHKLPMYHKNMCVTINSTFFSFVIFVCQVTMPRKCKLDDDFEEVNPLKKHKPPADRNRASPSALVTACKDMSDERMAAIDDMDFTSLRNIKCDNLFNRLSNGLLVYTTLIPVRLLYLVAEGYRSMKSLCIV